MNFQVELSDRQAWAIAQWLKRAGFNQWRALAASDEEAWAMLDAAQQLRDELSLQGYEPR